MAGTELEIGGAAAPFACVEIEQHDGVRLAGHCRWCGEMHVHGAAPGLRSRACRFDLSPGRGQSIRMVRTGAARSIAEASPSFVAFLPAQRSLCPALTGAAPQLAQVLVGALLGLKRPTLWARKRMGRFTVDAFEHGASWVIQDRAGDRVEGRGVLPLAAALSGATVGAVAVMVLRLLGIDLAPADLRAVAHFIDTRGGERS